MAPSRPRNPRDDRGEAQAATLTILRRLAPAWAVIQPPFNEAWIDLARHESKGDLNAKNRVCVRACAHRPRGRRSRGCDAISSARGPGAVRDHAYGRRL